MTKKVLKKSVYTKTVETPEASFPLGVWLENSKKMIGQPRYVIVGATTGRPGEESYTKSQMNALVKRFLSMK